MWAFIAPILAKVLEWILSLVFKILKRDYDQYIEKKEQEKRTKENVQKVLDSKTDDERRHAIEHLLNDR